MEDRKFALIFFVFILLSFNGFSLPDGSTAPMARSEQEAIYEVIQSFVGNWWNGSQLFPDPCGWTPIQGVSCDLFDGLWYITALNIGPIFDNSLECAEDAKFSPSLFELKRLRTLSFYECFSSQHHLTIPANDWEKLAESLETLEFRSNPSLQGEIPASIGQLAKLQSLVIVENSLSGQLPPSLGNLFNLQRLVLSGNKFSGRIPDSLGNNLTKLLILDLSRNWLTDNVPLSLGGLASLVKLDLSNNALQGSVPIELGKLSKLTLLDLKSNNLSGAFTQPLQSLISLQDLILSNNPIGGKLTDVDWQKLPDLTTLDLSRTGLTGTIPDSITSLKRLRFLALDNNNLNGNVPQKLEALPSLTALYLNGNNLTGALEFSDKFFLRMGRRFSFGDNPNLCSGSLSRKAVGVKQCRQDRKTSKYDNVAQNSIGLIASSVTGFWCGCFVQGVVIVFLLAMLL